MKEVDKKEIKASDEPTFHSDEIYYFNTHRSKELVMSLQNRYEGFDASVIPEIVEKTIGRKVNAIEPNQNFGTGHLIYVIDTDQGQIVFRANRHLEVTEHYMDLENLFTEKYKQAGIPTNTVLYSDTSRQDVPFDFQIMELLPGRDLEDDWDGTKEQYDAISFQLGTMIAKQYKAPVDGWGRFKSQENLQGAYGTAHEYLMAYVDYDLDIMTSHNLISAQQKAAILEFLSAQKEIMDQQTQAYLVHHDIADHNIRYSEDKVLALFDWENAVAYDPISELGSAPTWVCHYPRRKKLVEGFLQELGYEPDHFQDKISLYFLRTMLWKSAFALKGDRFSDRHLGLLNEALSETIPDITLPTKA